MQTEALPDGHVWLRIADPAWADSLDPSFAAARSGRWNPPGSHPTLYLNEDRVTARLNLRHFIAGWPYEPEDLRTDTGPVLVEATLPPHQTVADVHTPEGVAAAGLPATYPLDAAGRLVDHAVCQQLGLAARRTGLDGVRARSARAPDGAGRELAWFPASETTRARAGAIEPFERWLWG
jgi:RES domain-containing protein